MAKLEDYPDFEIFARDIRSAREAMQMSCRILADMLHVSLPRYLTNIELVGDIPSVPVVTRLARIRKLPMECYFSPKARRPDSEQWQRTILKLKLCPEQIYRSLKVPLTEPSKYKTRKRRLKTNNLRFSRPTLY